MKRMVWIVLVLVVAIGCGDRSKAGRSASAETFRVALMTPGPVSDDGWNASAYEGLQLIEREMGAEVAHKESKNQGEFKQDFRDFARRGYRVIFAHGFEFTNAARDVAEEFPDTYFVTTGGLPENVRPNYSPIVFVLDDAMYLLGVLAGKMTETNRLGLIGGQEIPPVVASFKAFEAGARSVNPNVTFVTAYVGNWEDAAKAREQASAQILEGVDLIVQNADKAGLGVFQAVKEASTSGKRVFALGTNRNQNHIEPSVILASAVSDIPRAFLDMARRAKDGTFEGDVRYFTLKGGWIDAVLNPALTDQILPEAIAAVEAAREALRKGEIDLADDGSS